MCVCVCVCVWERKREKARERKSCEIAKRHFQTEWQFTSLNFRFLTFLFESINQNLHKVSNSLESLIVIFGILIQKLLNLHHMLNLCNAISVFASNAYGKLFKLHMFHKLRNLRNMRKLNKLRKCSSENYLCNLSFCV